MREDKIVGLDARTEVRAGGEWMTIESYYRLSNRPAITVYEPEQGKVFSVKPKSVNMERVACSVVEIVAHGHFHLSMDADRMVVLTRKTDNPGLAHSGEGVNRCFHGRPFGSVLWQNACSLMNPDCGDGWGFMIFAPSRSTGYLVDRFVPVEDCELTMSQFAGRRYDIDVSLEGVGGFLIVRRGGSPVVIPPS